MAHRRHDIHQESALVKKYRNKHPVYLMLDFILLALLKYLKVLEEESNVPSLSEL